MFCIENKVKIGSAWASFRFNGETSLPRCCSPPCSSYKLFSTISARPLRRSISDGSRLSCTLMQKRWQLEMRLLFSSRIAFCWSGERRTKFDFLFYEIVLYFQWNGGDAVVDLFEAAQSPSPAPRRNVENEHTVLLCKHLFRELNKIHSFNFIDFASHWRGFCCDIKSLSSALRRRKRERMCSRKFD